MSPLSELPIKISVTAFNSCKTAFRAAYTNWHLPSHVLYVAWRTSYCFKMHYHNGSLDNNVIVLRTIRLKDLGTGVRSLEGAQTPDRPRGLLNPLPSGIHGHFPWEQSHYSLRLILNISCTLHGACLNLKTNSLVLSPPHEDLPFYLLEHSILHKNPTNVLYMLTPLYSH
jgi:hypothetical protein